MLGVTGMDEGAALRGLESDLKAVVFGQDDAVGRHAGLAGEARLRGAVTVRDLTFLHPLRTPDAGTTRVRLTLRRSEAGYVMALSSAPHTASAV